MEKDLEKISKILEDHERRISSLEGSPSNNKTESAKKSTGSQSLTDHIIKIRDAGFFSQPKTAEEVHSKLIGTYHCEVDRVSMALLRLAERKKLRKASKNSGGKKYKAYVW